MELATTLVKIIPYEALDDVKRNEVSPRDSHYSE